MFYDRFVVLCAKNGVKPSAAVEAIGIGRANATFWKKGSLPSAKNLQKLADYFGVSVAYLLGQSDDPAIVNRDEVLAEIERDKLNVMDLLQEIDELPERNRRAAMHEIAIMANLTIARYRNFRPIENPAQK